MPEVSEDPATIRLLFVCTGNTCRSPMAQVLSTGQHTKSGAIRIEARSAGTHTRNGMAASDGAVRAARRHGYSLESHQSSELTRELVAWADRVFAMTPGHLRQVLLLGGEGKAELLGAYGASPGGLIPEAGEAQLSVPDPFGGDDQVYEETFLVLENYVDAAVKRLLEEMGG